MSKIEEEKKLIELATKIFNKRPRNCSNILSDIEKCIKNEISDIESIKEDIQYLINNLENTKLALEDRSYEGAYLNLNPDINYYK